MTTIHLNQYVTARLNEKGERIYRAHRDMIDHAVAARGSTLPPASRDFKIFDGPLWEFMQIFGRSYLMGDETCTIDNVIEIRG